MTAINLYLVMSYTDNRFNDVYRHRKTFICIRTLHSLRKRVVTGSLVKIV